MHSLKVDVLDLIHALKFTDNDGLFGVVRKQAHAFQNSRIELVLAFVISAHRRNMRSFSDPFIPNQR